VAALLGERTRELVDWWTGPWTVAVDVAIRVEDLTIVVPSGIRGDEQHGERMTGIVTGHLGEGQEQVLRSSSEDGYSSGMDGC
jgi:hypothetical protein